MSADTDAVFTERIWSMAESRLEQQLREFRRAVFGDEHYLEELRDELRIDQAMRREPPPKSPTTLPGYKRHARVMRLRGW